MQKRHPQTPTFTGKDARSSIVGKHQSRNTRPTRPLKQPHKTQPHQIEPTTSDSQKEAAWLAGNQATWQPGHLTTWLPGNQTTWLLDPNLVK